ncbi:prolyl oligopeptidase family serine peptidase [Natronomonas salina]|uniref:prolyl oligopeptidase family serine peptidase n=1 Tax=Natronomonas salina TaxID=1710540 RepID=UPI0015B5B289|nr:prolyl oligopeptidase family serine peptidase [Natronomonas salina]QLD89827.1 prolyl oligopeptidase family serine peptidase [Natronomonas salina]
MSEESSGGTDPPARETPQAGPDALYGANPTPPQLENGPGWEADPLLFAGCDAYVDGEYLYQDYVYDDHGADTRSVLEQPPDGDHLGGFYSRPTGDYRYPSDPDTYAYNGADLLEFRARSTDDGVAYRITLNTMLEPDAAAVAVGIDTQCGTADETDDDRQRDTDRQSDTGRQTDDRRTDWGYGLGDLGAPVDHRLVTWGTGAELDGEPLDSDRVSVDVERNQIELEAPLDPGEETWRHYCVVGLWDDDNDAFQQVAPDADDERPGGNAQRGGAPPIFNVGFRFEEPMGRNVDLDTLVPRLTTVLANAPSDALDELDGPLEIVDRLDDLPNLIGDLDDSLDLLNPLESPLTPLGSSSLSDLLDELDRFWLFNGTEGIPRVLGVGNWREHRQATKLAERDLSEFHADVDFGALREGTTERNVPDSGVVSCLYPSREEFGDGVDPFANVLRGRIQPYNVYVPESVDLEEPAPMVAMLHSLGNCYNQYPVWMSNYVEDVGETCEALVFMPQTRGPGLWYSREAELDVFEAWRDLETRFDVDRSRVSITGYSMGGYGAIITAAKHPDCFGRCFPVVGPPAEDPLEAPTNNMLATPSLLFDGLFGGEGGGRLFTVFDEEPENALRLTENLRHVPMLLWHGGTDPLVPLLGPTNYAGRLRSHGYRHQIDVFPSDHFLLALQDRWDRGPEYLAEAAVPQRPARVTYKRVPEFDHDDLGLVHDGAHWVTDVEPRAGEDSALVDATSFADGYGEPDAERYTTTGSKPLAYTATGVRWNEPETERGPENALALDLEGVGSATVWIEEAGLDVDEELTIEADSDGPATVTLRGPFGTHDVSLREGESETTVGPLA